MEGGNKDFEARKEVRRSPRLKQITMTEVNIQQHPVAPSALQPGAGPRVRFVHGMGASSSAPQPGSAPEEIPSGVLSQIPPGNRGQRNKRKSRSGHKEIAGAIENGSKTIAAAIDRAGDLVGPSISRIEDLITTEYQKVRKRGRSIRGYQQDIIMAINGLTAIVTTQLGPGGGHVDGRSNDQIDPPTVPGGGHAGAVEGDQIVPPLVPDEGDGGDDWIPNMLI